MFIPNTQNDGAKFYLIDFATNTGTVSYVSCDKNVVFNDKIYKNCQFIDDISFNDLDRIDDVKIKFVNKDNVELERLLDAKIVVYMGVAQGGAGLAAERSPSAARAVERGAAKPRGRGLGPATPMDAGNIVCNNAVAIFSGFVENIMTNGELLEISVSSNVAKLNYSNSSLFSPICRECLGSAKCGVDLNQYKVNGSVTEIISSDCIVGNHRENRSVHVGYYKYGTIKFLSGKLRGIEMQIKDEVDGKIYLLKNTKLIKIGDSYEIYAGCNKTLSVCKNKFNNVINFHGEPYINIG